MTMDFYKEPLTLFAKMKLMHTSATSVELLVEGIRDGSFPALKLRKEENYNVRWRKIIRLGLLVWILIL
jgi:hypothetical protein